MSSSQSTVFSTVSLLLLLSLFLLSLIVVTTECRAGLIALEELDNQIGPYSVEWQLAPETAGGNVGVGDSAEGENWVPELLRLRKRWATQLRFGKKAVAAADGPIRQWASQVRFGRK
uniref:Uncharacterized protein n=1 Tax=Globodera rostochiensis TaxID=31243 RepID=A0A914HTH7_GLORO